MSNFNLYMCVCVCVCVCVFVSAGLPCWLSSKQFACNAGDTGSNPGLGRFSWRRKWQPTPVFFPGESQGQGSLVGCSPWGCKSQTWLGDQTTTTMSVFDILKEWVYLFLYEKNVSLMKIFRGKQILQDGEGFVEPDYLCSK